MSFENETTKLLLFSQSTKTIFFFQKKSTAHARDWLGGQVGGGSPHSRQVNA